MVKGQLEQRERTTALLVVVFFLVMISAISAAYSVHLSRVYIGQLSVLIREQDAVQMEWEKLLVEHNMLTAYNRIEKIAVNEIGMKSPEPHETRLVDLRGKR